MATARFYTFSKRDNSTAAPATSAGTVVNVVLKDGTSLLNPVLLLNLENVPAWSMFDFEERFYKVTDVRSVRQNLWEIAGAVDVLASWKADILAASAFVAYDTTANTEITDRRLSTKTTTTKQENVGRAFDMLGTGFSVVLNVVGENACATYILSLDAAATLLSDMLTDWADGLMPDVDPDDPPTDWLSKIADSITTGFKQLISSGSAADCIRSAYIIPIDSELFVANVVTEDIQLGSYNTHISAKRRTSRGIQDTSAVVIPWQAADWRRNAPYHEIYLYIPMIGLVSYPASSLMDETTIYIDAAIDETAGDALFTVAVGPITAGAATKVIGQYSSNIAANFAIGSSNVTPRQIATSVAAAAGVVGASILTGGAAAVAAGTAGIAGEFNSITPLPSSIGGAGGGAILALFGYTPRCMSIFHDTNVAPDSVSAIIGTPTNAVKPLSGLAGYVETRNFSVSGAMTESERSDINRLMDGGVYIE